MALWNLNGQIVYADGALSIPNPESGTWAHRHTYEVPYTNVGKGGIVTIDGRTYHTPSWIEVHPETRLEDINWIKPKIKKQVKQKPVIETNVSGSGLGEYTTKYYPESGKFHCTCPGYWRSGGNCKHVKAMREKLGEAKQESYIHVYKNNKGHENI